MLRGQNNTLIILQEGLHCLISLSPRPRWGTAQADAKASYFAGFLTFEYLKNFAPFENLT
jgi:hypothetical protein